MISRTRKWYVLVFLTTLLTVAPPSASAQSGNQIVEVDVQDITEFDIDSDVTLTFDEANGINGVDNRHNGWDEEALSSAEASTTFSIATNREDVGIDITGFSNVSVDNVEELQLAIRLEPVDEIDRTENLYVKLTNVGDGFSERTIASSLGPIDKSGIGLDYYGLVTPDFDPSEDGSVAITYTVTGD